MNRPDRGRPGPDQPGANQPTVGVAAVVIHDRRVLLGRRIDPPVWQFPGGHLRLGESFFACAERETREETGLLIHCRAQGPTTGDLIGRQHCVTVFVLAEADSAQAETREPDKCRGWQWFDWQALPAPLFAPTLTVLRQGYDPLRELAALVRT